MAAGSADEWRTGGLRQKRNNNENGRSESAVCGGGVSRSWDGSDGRDGRQRTDHEGQGEKSEQKDGELGHGVSYAKRAVQSEASRCDTLRSGSLHRPGLEDCQRSGCFSTDPAKAHKYGSDEKRTPRQRRASALARRCRHRISPVGAGLLANRFSRNMDVS